MRDKEQRRRRAPAVLWVTAIALLGACGLFQSEADKGREIADRWCSECHRIAADQPSGSRAGHILPPPVQAPSFMSIAARPETDADTLRHFVTELHLPMPTYRLSVEERESVIRYILSLRQSSPER